MKKFLTGLAIALLVSPLAAQQSPTKKPITHDVYDGWKSIQGTKVSPDGRWVVYALVPQDGDGELVVRNLKTRKRSAPVAWVGDLKCEFYPGALRKTLRMADWFCCGSAAKSPCFDRSISLTS